MKTLKNKVFLTIFSIFSVFLFILIFIHNINLYNTQKENIITSLNNIKNVVTNQENITLDKNIFTDYKVYTVILDRDNNIKRIVSHNYNVISDNNIKEVSEGILNGKLKENNLYFNRYFYLLKNGSFLIILDNYYGRANLILTLEISIAVFILLELLIAYLSKLITDYITKPAFESFEKQKIFIEDASHELKTPLAVIMASTDLLEQSKNKKKYIDNIKQETEKMNKLVCDMLDLSKLDKEQDKSLYKETNLTKLVYKNILTFEALAFEKNIKIETVLEDNINFSCDEEKISEVIGILLDNAIKHNYENENIKVELKSVKNQIILKVINKGKEIKKGDEERIFERFYRSDKSRNRKENRYGLGLAIAKKIIENHNGKITASSKDNITTFKITFIS